VRPGGGGVRAQRLVDEPPELAWRDRQLERSVADLDDGNRAREPAPEIIVRVDVPLDDLDPAQARCPASVEDRVECGSGVVSQVAARAPIEDDEGEGAHAEIVGRTRFGPGR
jgi:hypothetical protein